MEEVGRYQIDEMSGEGAMARVYKAYDPKIDRTLAIKALKSHLLADDEYRARFLREAKGAGILSHPNIVTVFDVGEEDRQPYIAMEWVDGPTLVRSAEGGQDLHAAGDRRDRHPARARARLRAQEGHRPSRRQAGQHHAGPGHADGQGRRLRHLPDQRERARRSRRSRRRWATCSERRTTCRPSRSWAGRSTPARICFPPASCSTSC